MFESDRSGKYGITFILFAVAMLATSNSIAQEKMDHQGLAPGTGIEVVLENCTVCHSADIILANHMSREAWDKTITWMQKEQGLWELGKKDRKAILDYLSKAQGVATLKGVEGLTEGRNNPMYEFDYPPNPL